MGVKDIVAGDKVGKALGARFIKAKKGTPGIEVVFEFEEPSTGNRERLNWTGWLSERAINNTMETLATVLGSNGSDVVNAEGLFTDPNFLDYKKEVRLVVEMEEARNEDGSPKVDEKTGEVQMWPRIKWVNNIGGSMYANVSPDVVKADLATVGFRAAFMAAKQQAKQSGPNVPNHAPGASNPPVNPKDVPF